MQAADFLYLHLVEQEREKHRFKRASRTRKTVSQESREKAREGGSKIGEEWLMMRNLDFILHTILF